MSRVNEKSSWHAQDLGVCLVRPDIWWRIIRDCITLTLLMLIWMTQMGVIQTIKWVSMRLRIHQRRLTARSCCQVCINGRAHALDLIAGWSVSSSHSMIFPKYMPGSFPPTGGHLNWLPLGASRHTVHYIKYCPWYYPYIIKLFSSFEIYHYVW